MKKFSWLWMSVCCAFALCACSSDEHKDDNDDAEDVPEVRAPLAKLSVLMHGAPANSTLGDEAKADQVFPAQFDLMATQSPVKDQMYRGVCSIFASVALMEQLYIKEGTLQNPDFSEQYLQWSVKNQLGKFPDSEGSDEGYNLQAIAQFGVPEESAWPYEDEPWSHYAHPECSGDCEDGEPVACYTNGEPPESAKNATMWKLPNTVRYVNSKPQNIKSYMYGTGNAAVAAGQFFYQSWNHGGSNLKVSNAYMRQGYVLYPNEDDIAFSNANEAGHAFLLVGWDDDLEVPIVDKAGKQVLDADGNPIVEKGFWLFKNSWGSDSFGVKNPKGAGYGWISYKYIEEFASVAVADEPVIELGDEICDDHIDNNGDHLIDCDDPRCADDAACVEGGVCGVDVDCDDPRCADDAACVEGGVCGVDVDCDDPRCVSSAACNGGLSASYSGDPIAIPDGDFDGVTSTLSLAGEGTIGSLKVHLDITHAYRGDLLVNLYSPNAVYTDGIETLYDSTEIFNGWDDEDRQLCDVHQDLEVTYFNGQPFAGDWVLEVFDIYQQDQGTLDGWSIEVIKSADK